jgi:hypothetical protein
MARFISFIVGVIRHKKRLEEESRLQERRSYKIELVREASELYFRYYEEGRQVAIGATFSFLNDVVIHGKSFLKWDVPAGGAIATQDRTRIQRWLIRYFKCWGGKVTVDDAPIEDLTTIAKALDDRGIMYEEVDGVVMFKGSIEDERKRKTGFIR